MAIIKFTDSTIPATFTNLKKQHEVTCGYQVTNSEFFNILIEGYLVTTRIPTEVSTGIPSNHTLENDMVTLDTLKDTLAKELEPMQKFDEQCYENFKKLLERFNKLEAFVYDD